MFANVFGVEIFTKHSCFLWACIHGIWRWGLKGVRKCCYCAEKLKIRKLPRKQTGQTNNGGTQENTKSNEKCQWQKAWLRGLACSGGFYMSDIMSFLENPGSSMRHRTCACSLSNISTFLFQMCIRNWRHASKQILSGLELFHKVPIYFLGHQKFNWKITQWMYVRHHHTIYTQWDPSCIMKAHSCHHNLYFLVVTFQPLNLHLFHNYG